MPVLGLKGLDSRGQQGVGGNSRRAKGIDALTRTRAAASRVSWESTVHDGCSTMIFSRYQEVGESGRGTEAGFPVRRTRPSTGRVAHLGLVGLKCGRCVFSASQEPSTRGKHSARSGCGPLVTGSHPRRHQAVRAVWAHQHPDAIRWTSRPDFQHVWGNERPKGHLNAKRPGRPLAMLPSPREKSPTFTRTGAHSPQGGAGRSNLAPQPLSDVDFGPTLSGLGFEPGDGAWDMPRRPIERGMRRLAGSSVLCPNLSSTRTRGRGLAGL